MPTGPARLLAEMRRRGLFAVLALYVVGAWVALQVAALAFPGWDIADAAIRYVWIAAVALFPIALLFGWRYDVTSGGLRRTPAVAGGMPLPLARIDYGLLAAMIAVAAGILAVTAERVLATRSVTAPAPERMLPENSIAVLPFVNMSSDGENEYFSDGISEQLLNELSRIPGLHVAARTSAFHYKNRNEPVPDIGRALGVRTVLEGSVRKAGNTVRVTAQLIDTASGYHLWSETYDRPLVDIFAVQDDIATRIAATLELTLLGSSDSDIGRGGTDDPIAYDLYLQAMAVRRGSEPDAVSRANELLDQALDVDPDFPLAIDALGYGYLLQAFSGERPRAEALAEAEWRIERALELEPRLEQAHASLGLLASMEGRYEEANEHYLRALDINPNYFGGQVNYGLSLVHQSRLKEASAAYLRAHALDPLNAVLNYNLGALLMLQGQYADGSDFIERTLELDPEYRRGLAGQTHWMAQYGRLADAVRHGRRVHASYPDYLPNVSALSEAYRMLGLAEHARALLTEVETALPDNDTPADLRRQLDMARGDFLPFGDWAKTRFAALDARPGDPLDFSQQQVVRDYGHALLLDGDAAGAAPMLDWAAGGEAGIGDVSYDNMLVLKLLALARQRSGDSETADRLLARCRDLTIAARNNGWSTPVIYVRMAEIHLLAGEVDPALGELEAGIAAGFRDLDWLEYGLFWRDVQDNPRFAALKLTILEDVSRQRDSLLAAQRAAPQ